MSETKAEFDLATRLVMTLRAKNLTIAVAESCTGGLLSAALTDIAGASDVFDSGFITYSNESKTELVSVPANLIERHGAVSADVAAAMAEGVLKNSAVDLSAAITGIAGPGGGSAAKPVGLVFIAVGHRGQATSVTRHAFEDTGRAGIRAAAVVTSLNALLETVTAV